MKDIFSKYGLKKTKARQMIYEALNNLNRPVSTEELHCNLLKNYSINLATVYRNLNTLEEINIVEKVVRQDGISYYYLPKKGHSHYMVCDSCNDHFELDICPLDLNLVDKTYDNGFKSTSHILEIHGICKKCQKNN